MELAIQGANMKKLCCKCKKEFPVAQEPTAWRTGELRRLEKAPLKVRQRLLPYRGFYLCGACYTDLTLSVGNNLKWPKKDNDYVPIPLDCI